MPRFHFNASVGDRIIPDLEGEELSDLVAARKEALAIAREILANSIRSADQPPDRIQVTDSDGQEIVSISLADLFPTVLRK